MQNPANAALRRIKKLANKCLLNIPKILFLGYGFGISVGAFSQEISSPDCKDCKPLNEVQVFGFSPEKFMAGLKVQKIDSVNLARFQYQSLSDFLQFQVWLGTTHNYLFSGHFGQPHSRTLEWFEYQFANCWTF